MIVEYLTDDRVLTTKAMVAVREFGEDIKKLLESKDESIRIRPAIEYELYYDKNRKGVVILVEGMEALLVKEL